MNFDDYKNTKPYVGGRGDKSGRNQYAEEEKRLFDKFKNDLFTELGISDNTKREILFCIAWDYGHSSGLTGVYGYACDLADLIK